VFFLASTPLVTLRLGSPTMVALVLALPLALTLVFLDRVGVVAAVCVTGVLVNALTLARLGWATTDLVHATVSMVALYGASLLGAMEFLRLRRLERAYQQSLRRAAAIQLQSERLIVLGTLAASVGHEINNPLAYVVANVSQLEESDRASDPDRRQVWEETRTGLARISAIVADLRGLARPSPAGVDAADLERLIRQAARMTTLRTRGVLQLDVQVEPHLPACLMDEQRVAQVLLNLAVNACDALEHAPAPQIRFRAVRQGNRICVSVEDNGPGVPAELKAKLFTPFFTTKPAGAGTGLGLALSREYLQAFGGSIDCDDAPRRWGVLQGVVAYRPGLKRGWYGHC
jgi:C4-dicarboxylate-specific signal transduction histidine kinase